jgi:hypothetical protein
MKNQNQFKFRAWNRIVERMQDFSFTDMEHFAGQIQWHNLEIMQYSATEDVNENLICQGDIVNVQLKALSEKGCNYEVLFDGNNFTLVHANRLGDDLGIFTRRFPQHTDIYRIIGTIYQNPELVKKAGE